MVLKRRTTQNIVWGGLAGCFPALIGWTAVTGELAWAPVVLFLVVFFWTPPHTWALALRYREDYAPSTCRCCPSVAPAADGRAARSSLYSWVMVATSLLLWPVAGTGWFYPVAATCWAPSSWSRRTGCGAGPGARTSSSEIAPMRLFHCSNLYLSLLFVAVALDPLLDLLTRRRSRTRSACRQPGRGRRAILEVEAAGPVHGGRPVTGPPSDRCAPGDGDPRGREQHPGHAAEIRRRAEHVEPTSTTGRSVKYCTKPTHALGQLDDQQPAPRHRAQPAAPAAQRQRPAGRRSGRRAGTPASAWTLAD